MKLWGDVKKCSFCFTPWYKTKLISSKILPEKAICEKCIKRSKEIIKEETVIKL